MNQQPTAGSTPLGPGQAVLAFDVGGTDTKSAVVDRDGRVLDFGVRRPRRARTTRPAPSSVCSPPSPANSVTDFLGCSPSPPR